MFINPIGEVYVIPRPRGGGESSAEGWRLRFLYSFLRRVLVGLRPASDDMMMSVKSWETAHVDSGKKDENSAFIQEMIGWAPTTSIPRGCRFVPYNYTVPKTSRHRWCLGMEKILVIHQGLGQFLWAYIFRVVVSLGGFWGHLLSCPQIFATLMNGFSTNPPPKMPTHPGEYLLKCFNGVWSVVFLGGPQYRTFSASVSSMPRDSVYIKEQFLYSWLPQQQISKVSHCEVRRGSHAGLWKHLQTRGFCWQRQPAHPRIFAHSDRQFVMGNTTLETATRRFSFR